MLAPKEMKARLTQVFSEPQATVLTDVVHSSYRDLVHTSDFNELKEIVRDLAAAQQRTEETVQHLDRSLQKLSRQVGGLSDRLGGDLEDVAYIVVHDVLAREHGWKVRPLARSWQQWNGAKEEIDLFGQVYDPARPDLPIWIVGEVKFNLTMKEVERFARKVARARKNVEGEVVPLCFCYRARPEVQEAVQTAGMRLVFSYGRMV